MRLRSWLMTVVAGAFAVSAIGCGGGGAPKNVNHLVNAPGIRTKVNLHPDEKDMQLYSTNYQMPGLIPVCSEVTITEVSDKRVKFTVKESGRQYKLDRQGFLKEPWETYLDKLFGTDCPNVSSMSEADQRGIKAGQAYEGMTKQGVIIAMGYPPDHATPNTESDTWRYWRNKFANYSIQFKNGVVSKAE